MSEKIHVQYKKVSHKKMFHVQILLRNFKSTNTLVSVSSTQTHVMSTHEMTQLPNVFSLVSGWRVSISIDSTLYFLFYLFIYIYCPAEADL